MRDRVTALEYDLIREAMDKTDGNLTRAAELLGLSRFGLQKMVKRLQSQVDQDVNPRTRSKRSERPTH